MLKIDRINELAYGLNFSNQNVYDFVPASKDMKNTILIIGKTGAGKSTIMNVLANRKLFGRKEKGNLIIDAVDSVSKIVHGGNSGTDKPKCYIDQQYTYFDCPGFFDNNGEEQEIKTAFYINYLFHKAKRVKLLVVIQDADTQGRINSLKELFTVLMKMFNNDVLKCCYRKIALIITKVSQQDEIEDVIERLKLRYPSLGAQGKHFFDDIISNHLLIFHKQKGSIDSTDLKSKLIDNLSEMDWIIHKTSIFLSSKTKQHLSNCFSQSKQKYLDQLQIFSKQLKAYYHSQIEYCKKDQNLEKIQQIERNFKKNEHLQSIIFANSLPKYISYIITNFKSAGIFLPRQCKNALNYKLLNQQLISFYDKLIGQLEQFHASINLSYYVNNTITQIINHAKYKINEVNRIIRDRRQERNRTLLYSQLFTKKRRQTERQQEQQQKAKRQLEEDQNNKREAKRQLEQYQNNKRQAESRLKQLREQLEQMRNQIRQREAREQERKDKLKREQAQIAQQNRRRREEQEKENSKWWFQKCNLI